MLKLRTNRKGFTLTEVMIGIAILTIAIVSASSLLVGLVNGNKVNLSTLQAYYLAQEGIEGVRNIRDSNWLHNLDWLGEDSIALWGEALEVDGLYELNLADGAFNVVPNNNSNESGVGSLINARPWGLISGGDGSVIYLNGDDSGFKRLIEVKAYEGLEDHILVESKVSWEVAGYEKEVVLSEVLTDWKGGAV